MEDLEKYIFDPENPQAFKAYGLLKTILQKKEHAAFIDPYFLVEIFQKEIFNKEVFNEIWDKPDNFHSLSSFKKMDIYIQNFSQRDFWQFVSRFNKHLSQKASYLPIDRYLNLESKYPYEENMELNIFFSKNIDDKYLNFLGFWKDSSFKNSSIYVDDGNHDDYEFLTNANLLFLLQNDSFDLLDIINTHDINLSSILITTLDDYKKFEESISQINILRPILLKKISDIHLLLNYLKSDINFQSNSTIPQKDTSPISTVSIKNYFSIDEIELQDLKAQKEIYFLGENGDGKTILLQGIALALKGNEEEGDVINFIKQNPKKDFELKAKDKQEKSYQYFENPKEQQEKYDNLFAYGISRFRNDSDKKEKAGYLTLFDTEQYLNNPVNWLKTLDHRQSRNEEKGITLNLAKEFLQDILEKRVETIVSSEEVIFEERGTKVKFEQLSDGYRSVLVWVSDLVIRLSEKQPTITQLKDFRGVVLVDEIGAFLHPKSAIPNV